MIERFTYTTWQRVFLIVPPPIGVRTIVDDMLGQSTGLALLAAVATAMFTTAVALRTHTTFDGERVTWASLREHELLRSEVIGAEFRSGSVGLIRRDGRKVVKLPLPYRNWVMPDRDFDAKVERIMDWLDGAEGVDEPDEIDARYD